MNKVSSRKIDEKTCIGINDVLEVLNIPLLGVVYEDESIIKANNNGTPLIMESKNIINKCYLNIAKRLNGEEVRMFKYKRSILERIFS